MIPSHDDAANLAAMDLDTLLSTLQSANDAYRSGSPIMSDEAYDHIYLAELERRHPDHPFLHQVEVEPSIGAGKVRHPVPMLSTDKVYTIDELRRFIARVEKAAASVGLAADEVAYRITPKLDGVAAAYRAGVFATRGDGLTGNDITHKLGEGIVIVGEGDVGELICSQAYFDEHLSDEFEHPRNFVSGLISADTLSERAMEALESGAIRLAMFASLPAATVSGVELIEQIDDLAARLNSEVDSLTDGTVIEVTNIEVQAELGSTSHHNNWVVARKTVGEMAVVTVEGITWSVGRGGRITPVLQVSPVRLSGATVENVTAHHAGNVLAQGIGIGGELRITRSGEVIPKIIEVVKRGEGGSVPNSCPSCDHETTMEDDFLYCHNHACNAKLGAQLEHFFAILGNVDGFGPFTCDALVENNVTSIGQIYDLSVSDFESMGFGPKQSENLIAELARSQQDEIEDWRWLAAFGIRHLGRGDSRKLLTQRHVTTLRGITAEDLSAIRGFGAITSESIANEIGARIDEIEVMLSRGFALRHSSEASVASYSAIAGKKIVFTGSMSESRSAMQDHARSLGAEVRSSVSGATDILVAGEKVGASKIAKAEKHNVQGMSEPEYRSLL